MPWRSNPAPYWVWVSEMMLQQTQVSRVIPKFEAFMARFPDIESLASAELREVLQQWMGLGYNRRAKFMHQAAQYIRTDLDGAFPDTLDGLNSLPGVGPNTAGAILAYAYNYPAVFIETNIRTVFIHECFSGRSDVRDAEIIPLIGEYMDKQNPREWYWAIMDYGSYLKRTATNPSRRSKHHSVQAPFEGSRRQVRSTVLRMLLERPMTLEQLQSTIADDRVADVVHDLEQESILTYNQIDSCYQVA